MGRVRLAIMGYGNVGKGVKEAVEVMPDVELAGVISRRRSVAKELPDMKVVTQLKDLSDVDVVALCIPSPIVPERPPRF